MRLISHRGNIKVLASSRENTIDYIQEALDAGYDVEIDVRLIGTKLYLGHDAAQEEVDLDYLLNTKFWVHAKTVSTFHYLSNFDIPNLFFNDQDEVAITKSGFFWTHPNCEVTCEKSILMRYGLDPKVASNTANLPAGVCSDLIEKYKDSVK